MKQVKTSLILVFLTVFILSCNNNEKSNIALLSNPIPTDHPIIFSQGVISVDSLISASITFNPDMDELFFNRRKPGESHNLYTMKLINGKWSPPEPASFSRKKEYLDFHSRFSPSGNRLYFGSTRPLNDTIETSGLHQWYIEKNKNGWGQPIPMEQPFLDRFMMCTTPAENGNLYFTSKEKEDKIEDGGIYYAINKDGDYTTVEKLGKEINHHGKWIAHPYIAPDESYIIYDAERTAIEENGDLYISFNNNGVWSPSYSLGPEINTELSEGAATVSPDGKYLFFSRGQQKIRKDGSKYWVNDIYWVDFIKLKKKLLHNMNDNQN